MGTNYICYRLIERQLEINFNSSLIYWILIIELKKETETINNSFKHRKRMRKKGLRTSLERTCHIIEVKYEENKDFV